MQLCLFEKLSYLLTEHNFTPLHFLSSTSVWGTYIHISSPEMICKMFQKLFLVFQNKIRSFNVFGLGEDLLKA